MHRSQSLVLMSLMLLGISCWGKGYIVAVEENRTRMSRLALGMSPDDIDRVMGVGTQFAYKKARVTNPWRVDSFGLENGMAVRIQYYLTEKPRRITRPHDDDLTPVVFEDDRVVGWGWPYLRRMTDRYQISVPREQR